MSPVCQMFAIVPAAGRSPLLGQPNLLLPIAGVTIVERLLSAMNHPAITHRYVVTGRPDIALQNEVTRLAGSLIVGAGATDPRTSVAFALDTIQDIWAPHDDDCWLLAPADHPVLDGDLIDALVNYWKHAAPAILVPRLRERRGHPTLFRWKFAKAVARIPAGRGLNWLFREFACDVTEMIVDSDSAITDFETPEDYARLQAKWVESLAG